MKTLIKAAMALQEEIVAEGRVRECLSEENIEGRLGGLEY